MDSKRDLDNHRNNTMYYNQMLKENRVKNSTNKKEKNNYDSFGSQKVDFKDYVFAMEGYEEFFYTLYFLMIPYIVGAVFLFFFVAGGDYENFMLLEISAFFIVWMIGYEIVATLLLITIFISFLRYQKKPKKRH
ncbi:MAG: hypothetical protein WCZ70_06535 [Sulfurimonadaceae bacterium]|jgi:hypothetical protein